MGACIALAVQIAPAAAQEELRIGVIAPMTGPFAQVGTDMTDGFNMYLEQANGMLGGIKVKVIFEDSQAKPDTAVTKAKKLILEDHVQMIVGGVLAPEWLPCPGAGFLDRREDRFPSAASVPAADDLTQRQLGNYPLFHPNQLDLVAAEPSAWPVGLRSGLQERISVVAADYAGFGYEGQSAASKRHS